MEKNKKTVKKKPNRKKSYLILALAVAIIAIAVAGITLHRKRVIEMERRMALEEQRRIEEAERERERRLLEERREEFMRLVERMREYLSQDKFEKVEELSEKALLLAKEYGFETTEIYEILREMNVRRYMSRLNRLKQELAEDIYRYLYVRTETLKIPNWPELSKIRGEIIDTTYKSEYIVSLEIARNKAEQGKKGVMPRYNYMSSKTFLKRGIEIRERRGLEKSGEEKIIEGLQNELFFASKELLKETIPPDLYGQ